MYSSMPASSSSSSSSSSSLHPHHFPSPDSIELMGLFEIENWGLDPTRLNVMHD